MKRSIFTLTLFCSFMLIFSGLTPFSHAGGVGVNTCGYEMKIVPVEDPSPKSIFDKPTIIDAWTTDDPFGNPYVEVYDFTIGQDTIAYVVEYFHTGGLLPRQFARGWKCGTANRIKDCYFLWTIGYLPAGVYLLINYEPVVAPKYKPTSYDWAAKVGNVVFGWPDVNQSRPLCVNIFE